MTAAPERLQVGDYELGQRIGAGRISRVYRAHGPGGEVAIKLLSPEAELDDPSAAARFRHEVEALAAVDHPNVVALVDHGLDAELGPYLVMPLLAGKTLRTLIADGRLEPSLIASALAQLADGLGALHTAGLVHRDLKPENVIVMPDGRLVIIDLGLAWTEAQTRHTEEGAIAGSVPYMAPEQIERQTLSPATDLWALAIIAHEWIAGERPFARSRPSEEVAAILSTRFEALVVRDPRVSPELGALIDSCLRHDPAARPQTGRELAAALAAHGIDGGARLRSDLHAHSEEIAQHRARALLEQAQKLLARGKTFEAAARIELAAAHRPDDPAVVELAGAVGRAPVRSRRSRRWLVALAGAALLAGSSALVVSSMRAVIEIALPAVTASDVPERGPIDEVAIRTIKTPRHQQLFPGDAGGLALTMQVRAEDAAASRDPDEHVKYARALLSTTRRQAGIDFLEASLVSLPDSAVLWQLRGDVAMRLGDFERAEETLDRAIELSPRYGAALRRRGELHRMRGHLRAAFTDLTAAEALERDDAEALGSLARVLATIGRRDAARPFAERAAQLRPHLAQSFIDLAHVSPDDEAIEHLEVALRNEPTSGAARRAMCLVAVRLDRDRAEKECLTAGVYYIRDPEIMFAQVRFFENRGNFSMARGYAVQGTVSVPDDVRFWVKMTELNEKLGYTYAVPKSRAKACELGHQPSCARATDSDGSR